MNKDIKRFFIDKEMVNEEHECNCNGECGGDCKCHQEEGVKIDVKDIDINDIDRESFYEKFAYVMQDDYIYDNTIKHNKIFGWSQRISNKS